MPTSAHGKLVVVAGNDSGKEFPLTGKPITVGRGIDNDVVLTDIAVSRRHLMLSFSDGHYILTDKGSGNGTIINQRVETGICAVTHGDRIEIGNTVFRFEHPASESESDSDAWHEDAPHGANDAGHDSPITPTPQTAQPLPPPSPTPPGSTLDNAGPSSASSLDAFASTPGSFAIEPIPLESSELDSDPPRESDPEVASQPSARVVSYPPGVRPLALAAPPNPTYMLFGTIGTGVFLFAVCVLGLLLTDDMPAPPPQLSLTDIAGFVDFNPSDIATALLGNSEPR